MAYDIFISYSSKDKVTADAVCARLEAHGWRCWIAPRDVLPGASYGESIIQAIHHCRLMVLVFSGHSNSSPQVMREVERAVSLGLAILPFRIENVPLSPNMEYFISAPHWLDALTPPLENHLQRLTDAATSILSSEGRGPAPAHTTVAPGAAGRTHTPSPLPTTTPANNPQRERQAKWWPLAAGALLLVIFCGGWALSRRSQPAPGDSPIMSNPSSAPSPVQTVGASSNSETAPTVPNSAPTPTQNQGVTKLSGRIGESLSSGSWAFEVLEAKRVTSYAMKKTTEADYALYHNATEFHNASHTFSPKEGNALLALNCRVTNTSGEKQALWHYDTNTALIAPQGESYPPVVFDMRGGQTQSEPLLPDTKQEVTVLFALPVGIQPKELLFTLKNINDKTGTDVRVSLE